ncbi:hypothetical protein AWB94_10550 [Mycolicibacterium canariasense]|nr:hypothetical protein AWB94_10550 [Mycolicibacterium canariasense]
MASSLIISMTALISGLAPAAASPDTKADPSAPTTTLVEAPEPAAPQSQAPKSEQGGREPQLPTAAPQPEPLPEVVVPTQAPPTQPKPARTPTATPTVEVPAEPAPPTTHATTTAAPLPATTEAPQPATTTPVPTTHTSTTKVAEPTTAAPTSTPKATPTATPAEPSPPPRVARTEDRPAAAEPSPAPPVDPTAPAAPTPTTPMAPTTPPTPADPAAEVAATPTVTGVPSSTETSSTATKAARPIETVRPQTLDAPEADVELARNAKPIEQQPEPAPQQDIAALAVSLNVTHRDDDRDWNRPDFVTSHRDGRDWDRKVRQWRPEWVQYDEHYRPIIFNPYRDPVRVVYVYQNSPRIVTINPLQRVVLYAAELAAYSFTAVVVNALNTAVNVAVGSFFGGGFIPAVGVALPPPPPPVWRYDNVPVQVRYSRAVYEPFRVQRIVDVGDDTRYGERKVLLDGVTPAWGVWTQTATGERQFEVHRTQQFPGLDEPREAPLPGDYRMQLVADNTTEASNGLDRNQIYLMAAAVACSVLSLGAVGLVVLMGRRRGL